MAEKKRKEKAAKRGRPFMPDELRRDTQLQVRLTAAERATLDKAASQAGLPPATYGRVRLMRDARRELGLPCDTPDENAAGDGSDVPEAAPKRPRKKPEA